MDDPTSYRGKLVQAPRFYKQWWLAGNPADFFEMLSDRFGDFVQYRGLFNFYLVNHPALVKQVLMETHQSFNKNSPIYNRFRTAFGNGLVVAEGDHWKEQRKRIQPLLGHAAVHAYFDMMVKSVDRMLERWESSHGTNKTFEVSNEMHRVTLEIVGRALFREGFDDVATEIHQWTETINHYSAKPPLPIIRSLWFPSPLNQRLKKAMREFRSFLIAKIRERQNSDGPTDLLRMLLQAKNDETQERMSDESIIDEAIGMIVGGHETSAAALTWFWFELANNPDIEKRFHSELDASMHSSEVTPQFVSSLRVTKMILDETLRLHPPFWFENRNVASDLLLGGANVPKGSLVVFNRHAIHRNPRFWSDPERFVPDRFAPDQEEHKRSSHAYVPFGGGPRICIGIHFAMMELLVIVSMVGQRFRLKINPNQPHAMEAKLTMQLRGGLEVQLERRT